MTLYNLDEYEDIPDARRLLTKEVMMSNKSFCDVINAFWTKPLRGN